LKAEAKMAAMLNTADLSEGKVQCGQKEWGIKNKTSIDEFK
jgi:hypothetical protein